MGKRQIFQDYYKLDAAGIRRIWETYRSRKLFFHVTPEKIAQLSCNDDLDLQLVWLKMLEEQGIDPSVRTFADYWSRYLCRYPWNEYGFFMRNFSRGLVPPVAGCFENYFVDEMGSPIRGPGRFLVGCLGDVAPRNTITARTAAGEASFTLLGPDEARGFPAGANVPECGGCHARVEACICPPV